MRAPKIKITKEWSEHVAAWLVECHVGGELFDARFSEDPERDGRAMVYAAAAEHA